jgi:hypothetical protein
VDHGQSRGEWVCTSQGTYQQVGALVSPPRPFDVAEQRYGGTRFDSWRRHSLTGVMHVRVWLPSLGGFTRVNAFSFDRTLGSARGARVATRGVRGLVRFGKGSSSRETCGAVGPLRERRKTKECRKTQSRSSKMNQPKLVVENIPTDSPRLKRREPCGPVGEDFVRGR